jgi:hypothetical protein
VSRDEFWKQFEGVPPIDCVEMKRNIQAKIYEEIKNLTMEERIDYFRRGSEEFRREMVQLQSLQGDLVLREEPPESGKTE